MKHPLHFSLTNIEYNQETSTVTITLKLFEQDLSDAIFKSYGKLTETKAIRREETDSAIIRYVNDNFSVYINDRKIKNSNFEFKGKKLSDDCVWLHFDLHDVKSIKKMVVNNSVICSLFPDQSNLMIININNRQQSFNLNCRHNMAIAE